ncbi:MAG TPA: Fe-S protein assembly co-chaperone HscB [Phycisphaerae bacterium]|nr:Fe-S protein assembly co-chaperone HscB [Phycisphaerae bacterium]
MEEKTDRALPEKCVRCSRPMTSPLFCDYCQTLHPVPGVVDHFQLLRLPRRFDIDQQALHESYVALSRHTHPDYHVDDSTEAQALSMTVSAAVNEAYRTLSDPIRRAAYLLELLGGPPSAEDKSVPDGFLETMMMMQEELMDARSTGKAEELARLGAVLQTQQEGLMNRVAGLYAELDQAVSCEATRQDLLHEIRKQLNAVAYVRKLLSQA